MTSRLRLILLVVAIAYSAVFGPAGAFGDAKRGNDHKGKTQRLRTHRPLAKRLNDEPLGVRAVRYARHMLGVPYRWGGDSPSTGFDCSGFVRFVYRHFGVDLPHSSYADFDLGRRVSRSALRPGDLVFFDGIGHVGMYVGGGRFIHAPHSGTSVQVTSLSESWYRTSYDGARRLVAKAKPSPRLSFRLRPSLFHMHPSASHGTPPAASRRPWLRPRVSR